jgi:hypothetical protein
MKRGYRPPTLPKRLQPRWETPDPPGVTGSYGPAVIEWASRELDLVFGPWQAYVVIKMLRHGKDGDLIHREALFSTARQNGKSVIVRSFYGWLFDVGRTVGPFRAWRDIRSAAHDGIQARIIYRAVYGDLKAIPRLTKGPDRARGEPRIYPPVRLSRWLGIETEGLFFDTLTSEPGSARGYSFGAIAFDEVLTQRDNVMMEAVEPTQSAQRNALLLLTSTAGHADSVVLRERYDRLRRLAVGDEKPDPSLYGVWWETDDPDVGYDSTGGRRELTRGDWVELAKANPGLGDGRLVRTAIANEHRKWPREGWQRERLNHFVDVVADSAFPPGAWAANRVAAPLEGLHGPYALGVDIQPGWERATIAVAGIRDDGRVGVEVHADLRRSDGEPLAAARIIREVETFPAIDQVLSISYDAFSGAAAAFARAAQESGLPWEPLKMGEMVTVSMDFTERVLAGMLAADDPLLDTEMGGLARRPVGQDGAFRFSRKESSGPIDAVVAAAIATHSISRLGGGPLIG